MVRGKPRRCGRMVWLHGVVAWCGSKPRLVWVHGVVAWCGSLAAHGVVHGKPHCLPCRALPSMLPLTGRQGPGHHQADEQALKANLEQLL